MFGLGLFTKQKDKHRGNEIGKKQANKKSIRIMLKKRKKKVELESLICQGETMGTNYHEG